MPEIVTFAMYSRAYGWLELQPGSSRNRARMPGRVHSANSIVWWSLLIASPGSISMPMIACDTAVLNGASVAVVCPGAGRPHAHDTRPEQSERYGSHAALSGRVQVDEQSVSLSCAWFGAWQYGSWASTHACARATASGSPTIGAPASGVSTVSSSPIGVPPSSVPVQPVRTATSAAVRSTRERYTRCTPGWNRNPAA